MAVVHKRQVHVSGYISYVLCGTGFCLLQKSLLWMLSLSYTTGLKYRDVSLKQAQLLAVILC